MNASPTRIQIAPDERIEHRGTGRCRNWVLVAPGRNRSLNGHECNLVNGAIAATLAARPSVGIDLAAGPDRSVVATIKDGLMVQPPAEATIQDSLKVAELRAERPKTCAQGIAQVLRSEVRLTLLDHGDPRGAEHVEAAADLLLMLEAQAGTTPKATTSAGLTGFAAATGGWDSLPDNIKRRPGMKELYHSLLPADAPESTSTDGADARAA